VNRLARVVPIVIALRMRILMGVRVPAVCMMVRVRGRRRGDVARVEDGEQQVRQHADNARDHRSAGRVRGPCCSVSGSHSCN
jgi:hypothetical protein